MMKSTQDLTPEQRQELLVSVRDRIERILRVLEGALGYPFKPDKPERIRKPKQEPKSRKEYMADYYLKNRKTIVRKRKQKRKL